MDPFEATKVVHERILRIEPEHVSRKIIGYIYLQDYPNQEMIRLALGPDTLIHNVIQKAKNALKLNVSSLFPTPLSPSLSPVTQLAQFPPTFPKYEESTLVENLNYPSDYCIQARLNYPSPFTSPVKACHYFSKGFCKNGTSCRYFHTHPFPESYHHMIDPNLCGSGGEDQVLSPGSLEKLEIEITELLKSKDGNPVSIASLPMMYYEKYGRTLQAEGYLTESRRHGKAGCNLTKLLARLKFIRLIERPHGQHSVILAEDATKYMDTHGERSDPCLIISGSRQIYLTFPAESTFTEEDVHDYFSTFGPVQDVRMPCQQKRMFGFVTFFSSDTVKLILSTGNPHYVCGARVLVKPYREKSKLFERKQLEKLESPMYYHLQHADFNSGFQERLKPPRLLRKQLMEEQALELESRRLAQLQLSRKHMSYFGPPVDESNVSQERYSHLNVINGGSLDEDNPRHSVSHYANEESNQGTNLPDSPFASAVTSSTSPVI